MSKTDNRRHPPASLPRVPDAGDGILSRLLINPSTDSQLAWALLGDVDPLGQVDGKPILQAFCEAHDRMHVFRSPLPDGTVFPAQPGEPWPDPRGTGDNPWPGASMWIAAVLIANSHDPFGWKTEDGLDVLDFVAKWRNDHLFNQLMRKPGAPGMAELEARMQPGARPWLHAMCANPGGHIMLRALLDHGMCPDKADGKKTPVLHTVTDLESFQALFDHGVDIWNKDGKGRLAVHAWVTRDSCDPNASFRCLKLLGAWCQAAVAQDLPRARKEVNALLFMCASKKKDALALEICQAMEKPLFSWRREDDGAGTLGVMAMEIMKKPTPDNRKRLVARMKSLEINDAEHCSLRDIPDIDLAFAVLMYESTLPGSGYKTLGSEAVFVDALVRMGMDPDRAQARKWEAIERLNAQPRFNGTKIDEVIGNALSNKAGEIFRQIKQHKEGGEASPEAVGLLGSPDRLLALASKRLNEREGHLFLSLAPLLIKDGTDHDDAALFTHVIELLVHEHQKQGMGRAKLPHYACLEKMVDMGVLPSKEDLARIQALGNGQSVSLLAKMSGAILSTQTAKSSGNLASPRF